VKLAERAAGFDSARYGGHSLKAGLIASAIEAEHRTMQHSRHWSVHAFRSCVREVNVLDGRPPGHQGRPVCRIAWPALLDHVVLTDCPPPPPGRGSEGIGVVVGWQEQVVDPRVVDDAADRR
jgi:hypothetical protein